MIFIIPPNISELKKRLKKRNTETDKIIELRLDRIEEELQYKSKFDHVILNNKLETAFQELKNIILMNKQRVEK